MRTKSKSPLVHIKFLDHCQHQGNNYGALECELTGRLVGEDKDCLFIATWVSGADVSDENTEAWSILKAAIKKIKYFSAPK